MGQEIDTDHFRRHDFREFDRRLREETELLRSWFLHNRFSTGERQLGLELEAWLIDEKARPAPKNDELIRRTSELQVYPELARFNFELNGTPQVATGAALDLIHGELKATWDLCRRHAAEAGCRTLLIGTLPTADDGDLTIANVSAYTRYRALNQEILRLRHGNPVHLDIQGREHLRSSYHRDVMLESGTTSLQVHLKVAPAESVRFYNASVIASAATVAAAANAPYLFGRDLWDETRIALFEQAVNVPANRPGIGRVTFGIGYASLSLFELFDENLDLYPVLLPVCSGDSPERLAHVRLHNGTIWRWNRPLIGFDEDGTPHIRIEHRVMAAGPSVADVAANIAFSAGLILALATLPVAPESALPFRTAKDNFYRAAKTGLDADVLWIDGKHYRLEKLVLDRLLPEASTALERLGFDPAAVERHLSVIDARVRNRRTGTAWQRGFVAKHGADWGKLTEAYHHNLETGRPVHEWPL